MISINQISVDFCANCMLYYYYIRHNKTMIGTYCLNLENLEKNSSKSSNFGGLLISFSHIGMKICPQKTHCFQCCKFSFELRNVFHISINNNNNFYRIYNYFYNFLFSFDIFSNLNSSHISIYITSIKHSKF